MKTIKMKNYIFIAIIATFIVGCSNGDTITSHDDSVTFDDTVNIKAVAKIMANNSSGVSGTVTFNETDGLVSMTATISGLTPGNHGIHIHVNGDCSADDGSSAGGHWNPTNVDHGMWGSAHFHIGDIGNIVADSNGMGTMSLETDLWCIDCKDETKNIIGHSIIIHEGSDNFTSQPSGDAGIRIGCGEIITQ